MVLRMPSQDSLLSILQLFKKDILVQEEENICIYSALAKAYLAPPPPQARRLPFS